MPSARKTKPEPVEPVKKEPAPVVNLTARRVSEMILKAQVGGTLVLSVQDCIDAGLVAWAMQNRG